MQNQNQVVTGIYDGAAYWGNMSAPAPQGFSSNLNTLGYTDLGFITEDGSPEITYPAEPEGTSVRVWQRAQVIRTVRMPSDTPLNISFELAQTNRDVIEFALGVTINADGSYDIDQNHIRPHGKLIVDVITERGGERYYSEDAVVTSIEPRTFPNTGEIAGWAVTVSTPHIRVWDTALTGGASPAFLASLDADLDTVDFFDDLEPIATEPAAAEFALAA